MKGQFRLTQGREDAKARDEQGNGARLRPAIGTMAGLGSSAPLGQGTKLPARSSLTQGGMNICCNLVQGTW